MAKRRALRAIAVALTLAACGDSGDSAPAPAGTSATPTASAVSPATTAPIAPAPSVGAAPARLRIEVVSKRPHDSSAFTQGLVFVGDRLFESTGQYGQSTLREVDPRSGTVRRKIDLAQQYFGEGLAAVDDRLVLLTWREKTAFVFRRDDFARIGQFSYDTEGWGLCTDGARLVMSDGSDKLYFRDPKTFALLSTVAVQNAGQPVNRLNELECVDGTVYANVWQTNSIVRIDPASGRVTAVIDAAGLLTEAEARGADVLNGIAYHPTDKTFLITGKNWPAMFEVRFVP